MSSPRLQPAGQPGAGTWHGAGGGYALREDDDLDEADEAEDEQGAGHIAPEPVIHLLGVLWGQWGSLPGPSCRGGHPAGWGGTYLPLQLRRLEGEQEALDVILAQLVDAARIDGAAQELVHLVLRVQGLLRAAAGGAGQGASALPPLPYPASGPGLGLSGSGWGEQHLLVLAGVIDALQRWGGKGIQGGPATPYPLPRVAATPGSQETLPSLPSLQQASTRRGN